VAIRQKPVREKRKQNKLRESKQFITRERETSSAGFSISYRSAHICGVDKP
jgi:hypothetical protein